MDYFYHAMRRGSLHENIESWRKISTSVLTQEKVAGQKCDAQTLVLFSVSEIGFLRLNGVVYYQKTLWFAFPISGQFLIEREKLILDKFHRTPNGQRS